MDNFEGILNDVIEHYVALQKWSEKPEGARKQTKVFEVILALDHGLKTLKKLAKVFPKSAIADPLQELAREIRTSFDTRENRAILYAAFNWRAKQRGVKPKKSNPVHSAPPKQRPINKPRIVAASRKTKKRLTSARTVKEIVRDTESKKEFVRNVLAYGASIPEEEKHRLIDPPIEHVDIWKKSKRYGGSYGSSQ